MKLDKNSKVLLKKFFDISENQKLLNDGNFDKLFSDWVAFVRKTPHDGIVCTSDLRILLDQAKIEYLSHFTELPSYIFWYYPYDTIHIDKNIQRIGSDLFRFDDKNIKMKVNYNGTSDEFLNIPGSKSLLNSIIYNKNTFEIICTDKTLINRERFYE